MLSRIIYRVIDEHLSNIYPRFYFAIYTQYSRLSDFRLYINLLFLNIFGRLRQQTITFNKSQDQTSYIPVLYKINERDRNVTSFSVSVSSDFNSDQYIVLANQLVPNILANILCIYYLKIYLTVFNIKISRHLKHTTNYLPQPCDTGHWVCVIAFSPPREKKR